MAVVMILGRVTGMAPMPAPIPVAIIGKIFGAGLPKPFLMLMAVISHLAYGGFWGWVLWRVTKRVTLWNALALGGIMWLIMQIIVLPFLGWGVFGVAITPKIAVATFVLHMIYGGTLGWLGTRKVDALKTA
ncbi:MAG: hypothetical protein EPN47_18285 [Acidobacteria bacterium]|nr:MAG: hypothetical protein EPN47_18285 [Acidobacteriota bacterium]